jgi:hypothetical protein
MLRPVLIGCIFLLLLFTGCEESPTEVEAGDAVAYTTFGGAFDDEGAAVVQTSDGGYLIVGNSYTGTGTSLTDLYAIKTDASGDTTNISTQIFSNMTDAADATVDVTSFDLVSDVKVLADGSYILVGSKYDGTATGNNYDVWLVKLKADLSIDFSTTYGGTGNDFGYSVSLCDDNGFIIAGKTYNSTNQNYDIWILKALSTGLLVAADSDTDGGFGDSGTPGQVAIDGGVGNDAAYSASQTDDGGFVVAGEVRTTGGNADMIVLRLNPDGTLPSAGFGNTDLSSPADGNLDAYINTLSLDESAKFVQETSDGGFILVGNTFSGGSGQSDIYIVKVSDSGEPVWDRFIGSNRNDFANSIQQTTDGGFILTGSTYTTSSDILVTKIFPNSQGEVDWQYTMDGGYDDVGSYISQTSDGGYILTGSTYTSDGMNDVILIKLSASGSQEF